MRTVFDFSPFYRDTVGFDRVFDMLDSVVSQRSSDGYPPYNIEKANEDSYRIVMAVAGFAEAELNVTQKEDELLVTGKAQPGAEEKEIPSSRHCRPRVRAAFPTRRPCEGDGRQPGQRPADDRAQARDPGGGRRRARSGIESNSTPRLTKQ